MNEFLASGALAGRRFVRGGGGAAWCHRGEWHGATDVVLTLGEVDAAEPCDTLTALHGDWPNWERSMLALCADLTSNPICLVGISAFNGGYVEVELEEIASSDVILTVGTIADGPEDAAFT